MKTSLARHLTLAGLLAVPALSCAEESSDTDSPLNLDEQIVTASLMSENADEALAAVTVINRETIERTQAKSLLDVFRYVPGVSLSSTGGAGKNVSLFMRGTNSNHVLVLIDGVKMGSVTTGTTAYQDLPVELIERIEVVRGPRSALYGSEAIGGVIQIFTRKGSESGLKPYFSTSYGTHDSYDTSAGVSGGNGRAWFTLALNQLDTDGIETKNPDASGYENDKDGYRELSGSLRAGYRFENGTEIDGTYMRTSSHNDYDSISSYYGNGHNANADNKQQVMSARLKFSPTERWRVTLQAGRTEDKSDTYQDGSFYSRFDTRRDRFSWQNDLTLAEDHILTLGMDHQHDSVNGTTSYVDDNRDDTGVFTQYQGRFGRHDLQLSLRHDHDDQFGSNDTGSIAWGYAFSDRLRGFVSYGKAFKAPTFNQLYYPGFGNPDLDPEESDTWEIGLRGEQDWGHWSANAYRTKIDDLIATVSSGGSYSAQGVDEAVIKGLELDAGGLLLGWQWGVNYTLMSAENRSSRSSRSGIAYHGKDLNRRPSRMLNVELDRAFGDFSVGASLHAQSHSYDDLENEDRLGGFATVDLRSEYRISHEWRVQARVANLLAQDYETADGYNQPGQAVYLSLRYQAF